MAVASAKEVASRAVPLRVLVVDDEKNIRTTLSLCLEGLGCRVEQAANSAAALEALRVEPFDLAFCDLRLGQESGLELLPRLLAERPGLEVIVITAYATVDTAVEAMRRGAKDYLPKPFTPAQIRHLVERALERRALTRRLSELENRLEEAAPEAVLARLLHAVCPRRDRQFVVVICPTRSDELLACELFGHARGAFTGAVKD